MIHAVLRHISFVGGCPLSCNAAVYSEFSRTLLVVVNNGSAFACCLALAVLCILPGVHTQECLEKMVFGKRGALTSGVIEKKDTVALIPGGTGAEPHAAASASVTGAAAGNGRACEGTSNNGDSGSTTISCNRDSARVGWICYCCCCCCV